MKQKRVWGILLLLGCLSLSVATLAWTDEDERWEHENERWKHEKEHGLWKTGSGTTRIINKTYATECSACHFAYPASFLPKRSWVKIMHNLENHFGENAELDAQTAADIEAYLGKHAADHDPGRFSRSILRSVRAASTPLRISETAFFKHKHREIPSRMVKDNPKVRSFSNCLSCHRMAEQGSFDEDGVRIPGYGRWED